MKHQYRIAISLCLGGTLVLSGCQNKNEETNSSQNTVVSQLPISAPPENGASVAPIEQSDSINARLTDFTLLDEQQGFVWGLSADSEFRLYVTSDGGESWIAISPEDGELHMSAIPINNRNISFLDSKNIWVAAEDKLYTTADGGATWQSSSLPASQLVSIVQVADGIGYALTSSDAAMNHSEKSLYVTKDGGASWNKIMENDGSNNGANPDAIPLAGHASLGMTFKDANIGWVPLTPPDDQPHLYQTTDGGVNWQEASLAVPSELKDQGLTLTSAPVFFQPDQTEGWVSAVSYVPEGRQLAGYFTEDAGETWTVAKFGEDATFGDSGHILSTFINREEGWILADGALLHTTDGGSTWKTYKDTTLKEQFEQFEDPLSMQFASSKNGWLLLGSEDGAKSVLLSTTDAGQHWTVK